MFTQSISTGRVEPLRFGRVSQHAVLARNRPVVGHIGFTAGYLQALVDGVPFLAVLSRLHDAPLEREPPSLPAC